MHDFSVVGHRVNTGLLPTGPAAHFIRDIAISSRFTAIGRYSVRV
jgi:hypothetical protein